MTAYDFTQYGNQVLEIVEVKQLGKIVYSFNAIVYTWVELLPELSGAFDTLSTFNSSEHRYFPRRFSETTA